MMAITVHKITGITTASIMTHIPGFLGSFFFAIVALRRGPNLENA